MFFHKFRKFLLFYTMLSVACGLFVSPVDAAQARTRKLPQRSRDAYPKTRYDSKRRKVSAKKSIKSLNSYRNVQVFLQNRDYAGLKNAVRSGLSLEGENTLGDTPVCTAVKSGDYVSFSMLKSAGANLSPRCMKEIPVEQRQAFIQRYMEIGGTMSLAAQEGMMSESSGLDALLADNNTLLIGGSIVGGALIAGAVAAGG
ncbi:MAG: hypothetical protein J6P93_04065, partial [Alphaproteobacteria bacterium]|nr:hypothetical protein [Alphaproteobacteria bacterium]